MIPVLTELITTCAVCGQVACERDLVYVEAEDTAAAEYDDLQAGDIICAERAEAADAEG